MKTLLIVLAAMGVSHAAEKGAEGTWLGTLQVSGVKLRLAFHINQDSATFDSLDQGAKGLPVSKLTVEGTKVRLEMAVLGGSYEGVLAGDELTGTFTQHGAAFPLKLSRVAALPTQKRPQEPKPPFPYDAVDVSYQNLAAHVKLAGTLTLPREKGRHPAVLLITGSGSQDRNEEIFGHKPFWVLADMLTRRGIAVLRVDDRGVGGSTGNPATSTTDDFVGDVLSGVAFLKSRPEIDGKKIGLAGHSEGGIIAPIAAVQSPDVAFVVMLAGCGVSGEEVLLFQNGVDDAQLKAHPLLAEKRKLTEQIFAVAKTEKNDALAAKQIKELMLKTPELKQLPRDKAQSIVDEQAPRIVLPWFRRFLVIDARDSLRKLTKPVLAINGERDTQVSATQNLPEIEKALKTAHNPDFSVKLLPKLNHLFQTCESGQLPEYGQIEETMSPLALQTIGDWVVAHTLGTLSSP